MKRQLRGCPKIASYLAGLPLMRIKDAACGLVWRLMDSLSNCAKVIGDACSLKLPGHVSFRPPFCPEPQLRFVQNPIEIRLGRDASHFPLTPSPGNLGRRARRVWLRLWSGRSTWRGTARAVSMSYKKR